LVQITHYTSSNYADHPQVNIHWIHCIENIFNVQYFWTTLRLPWKQSVPWIHCIEYIFFIIQNFEQIPLALKNRVCAEIFHCIEIFFIFQEFLAICACPENIVCPEFFEPGRAAVPPPPRLVRHWPEVAVVLGASCSSGGCPGGCNPRADEQTIWLKMHVFHTPVSEWSMTAQQRWAWTGSGLEILQDTCDFLRSGLVIYFCKKLDQDRIRIFVWFL